MTLPGLKGRAAAPRAPGRLLGVPHALSSRMAPAERPPYRPDVCATLRPGGWFVAIVGLFAPAQLVAEGLVVAAAGHLHQAEADWCPSPKGTASPSAGRQSASAW